MFLSAADIIVKNPKESVKKPLKTKGKSSKVTGYKTNIQKSIAFLYTNNKHVETNKKHNICNTAPKKKH